MANNQNNTRYGLGSGTPAQELERWLKEAGKITVHDEGLQQQLFTPAESSIPEYIRMYRLFNSKGESILITAETALSYGYRLPEIKLKAESTPDLFNPQEGLF